jgi:hypothetical protein
MTGHMGDETVTTQNLDVVRIDEARQLLLVKGAVPGAKGGFVTCAGHQGKSFQRSELMQLELLNEQGQAASKVEAPRLCSVVNTTKIWSTRSCCLPGQRPSRHSRPEGP